jgi:HK97 gp10 family phage protein
MSYKIQDKSARYISRLEKAKTDTLDEVANNISDDAKTNAPVKTGALRDSIHVEDSTDVDAKLIGSDLKYARFIEMGTRKISPRAYLRKALWSNIDKISSVLSKYMR